MKRLLTIVLLVAFFACDKTEEPRHWDPIPDQDEVGFQIKAHRRAKDRAFKSGPQSPLPESHKSNFEGLDYYPVDSKYRFRLPLHEYDDKKVFKIVTSTGMQRDAEKYGYFTFELDGQPCTLQVYKLLDVQSQYPGYLFVPFMDETTGKETYSGGRYLDLRLNESGIYELDFNLAYNPSCAYGKDGYNCPIPPAENKLPVPIRAGEKMYGAGKH